jgi:ACS family tartrate transporter-like MFS transporter
MTEFNKSQTDGPSISAATMRKIKWRLLPLVMIMYVVAFVDRSNIGFAASKLEKDLGITAFQFGLIAGLFFVGYFIFEVPSNMLLRRFGARRWIARILLTWGILAALTGFTTGLDSLVVVRVLLGIAEAGFFPGILLYLTSWFPERERARTTAMFIVAVPIATVIGGPVSGLILDHIHWGGLASWRWMFILQGAVAVLMVPLALKLLTDNPRKAKWLTQDEQDAVIGELTAERKIKEQAHGEMNWKAVLTNPRVLALAFIYFCKASAMYSLVFFTPTIVHGLSSSFSSTQVGLITALPYLISIAGMLYWGRHSDRTGERRFHVAGPYIAGAIALIGLGIWNDTLVLSVVLLCVVVLLLSIPYGPFWSLPSMFLTGAASASGLAWINAVANLGGFVGPFVLGAVVDKTGTVFSGLFIVAGMVFAAAVMTLRLKVAAPVGSIDKSEKTAQS